jgi:hypothetical protein
MSSLEGRSIATWRPAATEVDQIAVEFGDTADSHPQPNLPLLCTSEMSNFERKFEQQHLHQAFESWPEIGLAS